MSLSVYIYICIYICISKCTAKKKQISVYIYIYIYLLATPLFRRPLDDDPILRYFDTSILQCFDASCRLLRLDASLLRCFEASMPRCSIRESAREKERAREQARPRIPGPRIPGPRTGRQAGNRQAGREQAGRQRTGNYEVLLLASYSTDPGAPVPLRLPRANKLQATCTLTRRLPLTSRGRRISYLIYPQYI